MSEKTNFWTQAISAMNGVIRFGGISADEKCTESIKITAKDGAHRFVMEEDGPREGWTSSYSPGRLLLEANDKGTGGSVGVQIISENGDIVIKAGRGRIRFEAEDIEFVAKSADERLGNIAFRANNGDIDVVKCQNFTVREATQSINMEAGGMIGLKTKGYIYTICSNMIHFTDRTKNVLKKVLNSL